VYFSAAPLDSERHVMYLDRIEKAATQGKQSKKTTS